MSRSRKSETEPVAPKVEGEAVVAPPVVAPPVIEEDVVAQDEPTESTDSDEPTESTDSEVAGEDVVAQDEPTESVSEEEAAQFAALSHPGGDVVVSMAGIIDGAPYVDISHIINDNVQVVDDEPDAATVGLMAEHLSITGGHIEVAVASPAPFTGVSDDYVFDSESFNAGTSWRDENGVWWSPAQKAQP